jgi:H+/Cl- antiporter ClcA
VPSFVRASGCPPIRLSLLGICVALVLCGGSASVAAATSVSPGTSFSELTSGQNEPQTTPTNTVTTASTSTETNSNSQTLIIVALAAAVLLLSGIAFVIVRDARRVAPAADLDAIEARSGHDAAVRLRKRRAKAKAAKRQRKRTR